jgi:hypothetical protein
VGLQNDATYQDPLAKRNEYNDRHDGNIIKNNKDGDESDNDDGDVDGPTVEAHIDLAKVPCKYCMSISESEVCLLTITVYSIHPEEIATEIKQPDFIDLIQQFIYNQQHPDHASESSSDTSAPVLPTFYGKIMVYSSAVATFHAPSDISGIGGMRREWIRAIKSWRKGPCRYDTIFVNTDPSAEGM